MQKEIADKTIFISEKIVENENKTQKQREDINLLKQTIEEQGMELSNKSIEEICLTIKNTNDKLLSLVNPQFLENILNSLQEKIKLLNAQRDRLQQQINEGETLEEDKEKLQQELADTTLKLEQFEKERNCIINMITSMKDFLSYRQQEIQFGQELLSKLEKPQPYTKKEQS